MRALLKNENILNPEKEKHVQYEPEMVINLDNS